MNSVKKGNLFEKRVYEALEIAIANKKLFVADKTCKIYRQKRYFSKDRQADITIDIAIECFRPGAEKPNFFILVECKDFKKPIPISKLEDFYEKKNQIAAANSKCILFTTTSLQSSAFNYAASKGIGLVRLLDDESLMWLIERATKSISTSKSNSDVINVINAITDEYFISTNHNTFGFDNNKAFLNLEDLLFEILNPFFENESTFNGS